MPTAHDSALINPAEGTRPTVESSAAAKRTPLLGTVLAIACIVMLAVVVYRPTLFNFFVGDDLSLVAWFKQAALHPELVWREFCGPWMGGSEAKFYRPLVNAFTCCEYLIWGANGFWFRLTNLSIELISGAILAFIVHSVCRAVTPDQSSPKPLALAFFSGALFALYPLHCEPVNWIIGRQDLAVTLFFLFSLWSHIRWRQTSNRTYVFLSLASFIMALLSKEMAVIVPPVILAYEILFGPFKDEQDNIKDSHFFANVFRSVLSTLPYWCLLVAYFCLRKILLGDFIGGYPDYMSLTFDPMLRLQALRMMFVPVNGLVLGAHSAIVKGWQILLFALLSFSAIAVIKSSTRERKVFWFFAVWTILALAPVYKVFNIDTTCLNGRLAYLATAPLCVLLMYGASSLNGFRWSLVTKPIAYAFLLLAAVIVYENNLAWAAAGILTNRIIQQLRLFYKHVPEDPLVFVTGLPLTYKGAYVAVNAISGLGKSPFLDQSKQNLAFLDPHDQSVCFGFLKEATAHASQPIHLLYWDFASQSLKPVAFSRSDAACERLWRGAQLKSVIIPPVGNNGQFNWERDGALNIVSLPNKGKHTAIDLKFKELPCWSTDFLQVALKTSTRQREGEPYGAELLFKNEIIKEFTLAERIHADLKGTGSEQRLLFSLRGNANWALGGTCSQMRLLLPDNSSFEISEIAAIKAGDSAFLPKVQFQGQQTEFGVIHVDASHDRQSLLFDALSIEGCKQVELEVLKAGVPFDSPNSQGQSKLRLLTKVQSAASGAFTIERADFPAGRGIYKARVRALNAVGDQLGVASDHFLIYVD